MVTKSKNKRLVLLDAHAIIHRAYHALPDFSSSEGEPTGALYGLSAMLLKIAKDLSPDYLVAAYDLPEPTDRHKAFDEYKAGREKADDELVHQIERSRDIFKAFNIPVYEKVGFEADDIIGTIVGKLRKRKTVDIVIASGDMDTLQLVEGRKVRVYTLRKGIRDTIIYDEKSVNERFGFGPGLLPDFKGLRGDPSDNIPGVAGVGEKTATQLIKGFGSIEEMYKELKKKESSFEKAGIKPRIVNLLKEQEEEARFSKMLAEIRKDAPINFSLPEQDWLSSVDTDEILKLFRELGFRTLSERVKDFFSVEEESGSSDKASSGESISESDIRKVGLALWVLDSEHANPGLDDILSFSGASSFRKAKEYIFSELKKQNLYRIYKDIELPLISIIDRMYERGIKIDIGYLKKLSKDYHAKLDSISKKVFRAAGGEFNLNSPRQLAEVLFDKLGLKGKAKTATGQRSTRESELVKLSGEHTIVTNILKHRELQKLLSTYIDNIPHMVSPQDGRLHAQFLQAGTTTGRMSSQNPNLQNIPIRTDLGKAVRNAFVSETGFKLVSFDYSQIELRIAAILSGDKRMIDIFKSGGDIHDVVAKKVFGKADAESRRRAKIINFGILYGMGPVALGKAISASRTEGSKFLESYRKDFSGLSDYVENIKLEASKKGYTETLFGRRRYLPGIKSHLPYVRAEAERMAVNAPAQGTSADVIKIAMRVINDWTAKNKLESKVFLVLQVHDELVYEMEDKLVGGVVPEVRGMMEGILTKKQAKGIPLVVGVSAGDNWGEMKKLYL